VRGGFYASNSHTFFVALAFRQRRFLKAVFLDQFVQRQSADAEIVCRPANIPRTFLGQA
jgi:hypothetical protein